MSTPKLPLDVIGDAYANDTAWDVLTDLVNVGPRMAGQEGERRGADVVREAFETAGLRDVGIDEFEIPGWWRGGTKLSVAGVPSTGSDAVAYRHPHEVLALPGSPSGSVEGRLVDCGYGTQTEFGERDVEGAIVLVSSRTPECHDRWLHRMEKYASACEAGAAGFVFRNHVEGCLPPTGEVGYHNRPGPIPSVGVSRELGERLERWCVDGDESDGADSNAGSPDDGSAPTVSLDVDCRNEPATSRNVQGVLGPKAGPEILLTAHVDSHDVAEGAMDNGAGCALLAEIGRLLAPIEEDLPTRIRVVTFGSEEIGLYGAYHHAESRDLADVSCVLNVDGVGRSRSLRVGTSGFEGIESLFEATAEAFDVPLETGDTVSPHGDQWAFVERGVPSAFASSASGDSTGRGWGHTHADTLDKIDRRDLRELAVLIADAAVRAGDPERTFERRSTADVYDDLDGGYMRELEVGGRFNLES